MIDPTFVSFGALAESSTQPVDLGKYFSREELASFAPIELRSYEAIARRHLAIMKIGISLMDFLALKMSRPKISFLGLFPVLLVNMNPGQLTW